MQFASAAAAPKLLKLILSEKSGLLLDPFVSALRAFAVVHFKWVRIEFGMQLPKLRNDPICLVGFEQVCLRLETAVDDQTRNRDHLADHSQLQITELFGELARKRSYVRSEHALDCVGAVFDFGHQV